MPRIRVPRRRWPLLRWFGNVVNLSTPLGLLLARAGGARLRVGPRGLVLAEGYRYRFPTGAAFTVGNVIITATSIERVAGYAPDVLGHEEAHCGQYLWCFGLPFLPLYAAAMAWSWLRTGDRFSANVFERAAGLTTGGYAEAARPWRTPLLASGRGRSDVAPS